MKTKLLRFVWGLVLLLTPGLAFAQEGTIEGTVVDPQGEPLPGANVALEGTTYGTATDLNGFFRFTAPAGEHTLGVSFVGYANYSAPVTVVATETLELRIQLTEGAIDLDEVVVTALGIQREERSLGYSYQEVEPAAIQRSNESSLINALSGKVAGLQVTSSSGQPGKAARIIIRGNSSFVGNNQPLFVIDGMPISNDEDDNIEESNVFTGGTISRALDIDPNIIDDITVLKGAAAMALYGSRAANGAIVITTKSGRGIEGTRVTFSSTVRWDDAIIEGFQDKFTVGDFGCFASSTPTDEGGFFDQDCYTAYWQGLAGDLTPREVGFGPYDTWADYVAASYSPQTTRNWGPSIEEVNANPDLLEQLNADRLPVFDPRSDFYRTGAVTENNLSIAGGALGGSYFLSGSYLGQEGIVPGTNMGRASLLAKFSGNLGEKLNAQTSLNYVHTENDWVREGNGTDSYLYGLNFTGINYDITQPERDDGTQRTFHSSFNNPFWLTQNNVYTSGVDRFIGSVSLTYTFTPWLSLTERGGIDTYNDNREGRVDVGTRGLYANGMVYNHKIIRREINNDLILRANTDLGRGWGFDGLIGHNLNRANYDFDYIEGIGLGVPGFFDLSNAGVYDPESYLERRMLLGVYSQLSFDYDDWLYLTGTGRNDWSSTLPEDNNSYFYPSISLGLIFTEAFGLFDGSPLSYGKFRASVARIGNDAPVYSTSTNFVKADPGDGVRGEIRFPLPDGTIGFEKDNVFGREDLRPELSTEYEVGLDLRFWDNRARIDAAYYDRTTKDQIFSVPISAATGYVQKILNAGELRNHGVEFVLGLTPIQTNNFAWDLQANWSTNRTEVIELAEGIESIFLAGFEAPQIRVQAGDNGYGVIYGSGFERANQEDHADLLEQYPELEEGMLLIGEDGLPLISGELQAIGNVQPDWLGSLRSSLTWKGLTASALMDVRRGGDVLNFDLFYTSFYGTAEVTEVRGSTTVYEGFNVDTGQMNDVEVVKDKSYYQDFFSSYDENFVEDGSYIKLREVSLGYSIPTGLARRIGVQGAQIIASGRNLWIDSDFSYGDPEGSLAGSANGQGFYHMVTPSTRSYSLGVRLTL